MKAQFSIKQVNVLKNSVKVAAKAESTNLMKFLSAGECCKEYMLPDEFKGLSKPVFSL
ncbi:hypothetical protein [Spirosoma arcticum]